MAAGINYYGKYGISSFCFLHTINSAGVGEVALTAVFGSSKQRILHSSSSLGSSEIFFVSVQRRKACLNSMTGCTCKNTRKQTHAGLSGAHLWRLGERSPCNLASNKGKLSKHEDGLIMTQII